MTTSEWNIPSKDLFDMMTKVSADIAELRADMRAYNGLRQRLDTAEATNKSLEARVLSLEQEKAQAKGRTQVWEGLRGWIPVAIAAAGFVLGRFIK